MKSIKLSIICPVYNAEHCIPNLIESVLKQTYQNWELILVNDGSTDATRNAIECFLDDKRIVLQNQKNSGPSTARNVGIALATGTWITFVDADDTISINYLQSLFNGIADKSTVDLVCAGYYECNNRFPVGIALHDFQSKFPNSIITQQEFIKNLFHGVTGVLWAKLFRHSIIKENNLKLHPNLKLSEDLLFVLQYAKHIKSVAIVYENIYYYNRIGELGLSGKLNMSYLDNLSLFDQLIIKEFENYPDYNVVPILKKRTVLTLLKIVKDEGESLAQFQKIAEIIRPQLGEFDLLYLNRENKLLALLIHKKKPYLAFLFNRVLQSLRKMKNA